MKTTLIQLEEQDDAISVQDRITWAKSARVVLVWPDSGRVLTRYLDLVRLQRFGRQQAVQIGLVTRDPEVEENARELGIPVFRNQKRALRSIWRRKPQRLRLLRPRRGLAPPANELRKQRPNHLAGLMKPGLQVVFFLLGLAAVIALVISLMPAATVVLPLEKMEQRIELVVRVDPTLTTANLTVGVPAQVRLLELEGDAQGLTSGKISIPDQSAQGEVVFNNLTSDALLIPQGTVLLTTGGEPLRFRTTRAVEIPGGVGQEIQAPVVALMAGSSSNVAAGSIQAVEGEMGAKVSVANPELISGGTERSSAAASVQDIEKLRATIMKEITATAAEWLRAEQVEGVYVLPDSLEMVRILEEEQIPASGQGGETIYLRLKVEFSGWVIQGEDLEAIASQALEANLPAGNTYMDSSIGFKFGSAQPEPAGGFRWQMEAQRIFVPMVEASEVTARTSGKPRQQAEEVLQQAFALRESPQLLLAPDWWPWLPLLESQIQVVVR